MARPAIVPVNQGIEGWDAFEQTNFAILMSAPLPIYENATLTESTIAATFPAASYDRCIVWVNHSVYGYTLFRSDGTSWFPFDARRRIVRDLTGTATLTTAEQAEIITVSAGLPFTVNLPSIATTKGRTFTFKTLIAGTLTLDASGAETIDGALTQTITVQYGVLRLYNNGTVWLTV